jgi:hypothetical protein
MLLSPSTLQFELFETQDQQVSNFFKKKFIFLKNKLKKKIKNIVAKNKFKMAAQLKMATNTSFACKNYKSSFFRKKFQGCFSCLNT